MESQKVGSSIEREALQKVLREQLESEIMGLDPDSAKRLLSNISLHSRIMKDIVGEEYDSCVNQLVHNIKYLQDQEQKAYLSSIEAFAKAYTLLYPSKKLLLLMLKGIAHTTSTPQSVSMYTYELYKTVKEKQDDLLESAAKESIRMNSLRKELERARKGVLRLFKRKEIKRLEKALAASSLKTARLQKKIAKYDSLSRAINELMIRH